MNIKNACILLSAISAMLLCSACTSPNAILESKILEQSGVYENADYIQSQEYLEAGNLDENGYYHESSLESEVVPSNAVRITFSVNPYLKVEYYLNGNTDERLQSGCILNPGDCIYATWSESNDIPSSSYVFSFFRLSEIDDEGIRYTIKDINPGENKSIFEITSAYAGKNLVIDACGKYLPKSIMLDAKYFDSNEEEHAADGVWYVNNNPVYTESININPLSTYIIAYKYNPEKYFYISSNPKCFFNDKVNGTIDFELKTALDTVEEYHINLHEYLSVDIPSSSDRFVSASIVDSSGNKSNIDSSNLTSGEKFTIHRLKYGDYVVINTDSEWPELETSRDLILSDSSYIVQGPAPYSYKLVFPQKGGEFEFNPKDYSFAHGEIDFKCFGEVVSSVQYLSPGSIIFYEQRSADSGYHLSDGEHRIKVTTPEETVRQLKSIQFIKDVPVTVNLPQPKKGGTIVYSVNGTPILGNTYECKSGTLISLKYKPWQGWITSENLADSYSATDVPMQTVLIGKGSINGVFEEDVNHKPTFEVLLNKSVDTNAEFSISADGIQRDGIKFNGNLFTRWSSVIEKNNKIGTSEGIKISMKNRALQAGTALKILFEMSGIDKSGNKNRDIYTKNYYLITDLSEPINEIEIYDKKNIATSSIWYDSIKISISVVDVMTASIPLPQKNTSITIRNSTTSEILKNGDTIEGSEKVIVTLSPKDGYYLTGKNIKNDIFQDTIYFSNCQYDDIQQIFADHPASKCISVLLDKGDPYGTCKYLRNNLIVPNELLLRPGDKITLEYHITNPSYIIDRKFALFEDDLKNAKSSITIGPEHDLKTINRESFGIIVKKVS